MPLGVDRAVAAIHTHVDSVRTSFGTFHSVEPVGRPVWRPFRRLSRVDESRLVLPVAGVVSRVDPLMSRAHAQRMRAWLRADYEAIRDEAPGLLDLPGSIDLTASNLAGLTYDTGHYYAFVPDTAIGERLGAMVFLHGHAGNFRMLIWRWRSLAVRARLAILAPSCGFGFWGRNSAKIVTRALADACRLWPVIDPGEGLWLCGLSAGGSGTIRAARSAAWHGLIFVSATMRPDLIDEACSGTSGAMPDALVFNGLKDHNVSPSSVNRGVRSLIDRGVDVERFVYDEEDHFLVFAQAADLDSRMIDWMSRHREASERPKDSVDS
ncbi:hypothetical protein GC170_12730 [bacterium]|nr:hypothetical protein [bacterium]